MFFIITEYSWENNFLESSIGPALSVDKSKNLATKKSALKMINQLIDLNIE